MPHLQIGLTLREAPYIADALDEYRDNHADMNGLLRIRFRQLSEEMRDMSERGLRREAELEAKRWGAR